MNCRHSHSKNKASDKLCMSQVPIFNHLSDEELLEVANLANHTTFKKGEIIFLAEEHVEQLFIINNGKVKISRISHSGREQILRILGPGEFLGELALFGNSPLSTNAEALDPTEICVIHGRDLKNLVLQFPNIAVKILEEFSKRLEKTESLIEQLGLHDIEQRIAGFLLELSKDAKNKDGPIDITLSISKKDLASLIGTTQETLSRKLAVFQEKGWIKLIGQRRIIILDEDRLNTIIQR